MNRNGNAVLLRSVEDLADAKELRAVISAALTNAPIDEQALRCAVWSFVGTERRAGVPPAIVIMRLSGLIDDANITPIAASLALTRKMILWCVEEYFGHLGGDALAMDSARGVAGSRVRS
ncbi:MAG TPA: hypothetical protein VIP11_05950 [Gemmatimonadaceae bacterium]